MVSLAQAKLIAAGAREYADKHHWTIAIAVVNNEGSLVYFERADKAQQGSIDGAIAKAKSSNAHRRPTRVFAEDVKKGRVGLVTMANVVAVEGGLPIIINGVHEALFSGLRPRQFQFPRFHDKRGGNNSFLVAKAAAAGLSGGGSCSVRPRTAFENPA